MVSLPVAHPQHASSDARRWLLPAALGLAAVVVALLLLRVPLPAAAVICATAVGVAAALAWPMAGLLLFLVVLYVRPEDYFPELIGLRYALLLLSASFLSWGLRCISVRGGVRWSAAVGWMAAFAAAAIASLVPLGTSILIERATEIAKLLVLFVMITQLVDTPGRMNTLCAVLVALSVWLAGVSIVGYYTGHGLLTAQGYRAHGMGAFADPNDTALTLVVAVPFLALGLMERGRRWVRIGSAAGTAVILWALYLTNSRGGFLALAATLVVFGALTYGRRGLALGLLFAALLILLGPSRLGSVTGGDESAAGRVGAWRVGLNLLAAHPVLGVGMGEFTQFNELTAHNSLVLAFAELGLVGAVCWVGLFVAVLFQAVAGVRANPASAWAKPALAAVASVIGFITGATFLSRTYFEIPYLYLGAAAAAAVVLLPPGRMPRPFVQVGIAMLLTLGGVAAVVVATRVAG